MTTSFAVQTSPSSEDLVAITQPITNGEIFICAGLAGLDTDKRAQLATHTWQIRTNEKTIRQAISSTCLSVHQIKCIAGNEHWMQFCRENLGIMGLRSLERKAEIGKSLQQYIDSNEFSNAAFDRLSQRALETIIDLPAPMIGKVMEKIEALSGEVTPKQIDAMAESEIIELRRQLRAATESAESAEMKYLAKNEEHATALASLGSMNVKLRTTDDELLAEKNKSESLVRQLNSRQATPVNIVPAPPMMKREDEVRVAQLRRQADDLDQEVQIKREERDKVARQLEEVTEKTKQKTFEFDLASDSMGHLKQLKADFGKLTVDYSAIMLKNIVSGDKRLKPMLNDFAAVVEAFALQLRAASETTGA